MADEHRGAQARRVPRDGLEERPEPVIGGRRGEAVAGEIEDVDPVLAREGPQDSRPSGDRVAQAVQDEQLRCAGRSAHRVPQAVKHPDPGAALGEVAQERERQALQGDGRRSAAHDALEQRNAAGSGG